MFAFIGEMVNIRFGVKITNAGLVAHRLYNAISTRKLFNESTITIQELYHIVWQILCSL